MLSVFIVVDLHVAVNSVKPLSVDMETEESIPCTQFSVYKFVVQVSTAQKYKVLNVKCPIF